MAPHHHRRFDWDWLHGASQRYDVAVPALTKAVEIAALVARYQGDLVGADELLTIAGQLALANDDRLAMARTRY